MKVDIDENGLCGDDCSKEFLFSLNYNVRISVAVKKN